MKKWDKKMLYIQRQRRSCLHHDLLRLSLNVGYLKKKKVTDETVHNRIKSSHAQDVPNILLVIGQFCLFTGVEGSFMV